MKRNSPNSPPSATSSKDHQQHLAWIRSKKPAKRSSTTAPARTKLARLPNPTSQLRWRTSRWRSKKPRRTTARWKPSSANSTEKTCKEMVMLMMKEGRNEFVWTQMTAEMFDRHDLCEIGSGNWKLITSASNQASVTWYLRNLSIEMKWIVWQGDWWGRWYALNLLFFLSSSWLFSPLPLFLPSSWKNRFLLHIHYAALVDQTTNEFTYPG